MDAPRSRTPSPERKRSPSQTGSNPNQNLLASFESPNPLQRETSGKMKKKFGGIHTDPRSQKHHPVYTNADGKVIKVDDWAMDKMEVGSFLNFNERNKADLIRHVVNGWNCNSTIIDDLLNTLEMDFGGTDDLSDEDLELIEYLTSLKENITTLRVADLAIQCTNTFTIKTNPKVVNKGDNLNIDLTLDWKDILREGRKLVKEQMVLGKANPAKEDVIKIVDKVIKGMTVKETGVAKIKKVDTAKKTGKYPTSDPLYQNSYTTEESLQRLNAFGFLSAPPIYGKTKVTSDKLDFDQGNSRKDKVILNSTTPTFKQAKATGGPEEDVEPTFEFSKGHVRFILYMEWKAISQLLNLTDRYK